MGQPTRKEDESACWNTRGLRDQRTGGGVVRQAQGVGRRSLTNTTTGSERVAPGQRTPTLRNPLLARLVRPIVAHWQFSLVVAAAIVMRIVVILGYPPIFWFSDSYNYFYDAVTHIPDEVRPNGYPFLLDMLLPLHSDYSI